jgi:hypothetical protein
VLQGVHILHGTKNPGALPKPQASFGPRRSQKAGGPGVEELILLLAREIEVCATDATLEFQIAEFQVAQANRIEAADTVSKKNHILYRYCSPGHSTTHG